jgi:4-hydroxy-3-polyprenylbenzoate decarboxylase
MPLSDLREFLSLLQSRNELARIGIEVDPVLEIAAITDRVCKGEGGGRALLFESVKGHPFSVATNLFGSFRRMAWALDAASLEDHGTRMDEALQAQQRGSTELRLQRLLEEAGFSPRRISRALCREVTAEDPDLLRLPALKNWPGDGGRFLTLPLVFTRDPESGRVNCGMYRVQIYDKNTAGLHWSEGSDGSRHAEAWARRGEPMPVAIALGGPPALIYAAAAPLPPQIAETEFAGWLRREAVEMVECQTCDLEVPAAAEFVLEGYLDPGEIRLEGPFGNHTGFYAPVAPAPVFRLLHLTHRSDPLCPCTVVGPPPMENVYMGRATERLFAPLLKNDFPEIADIHFLAEGIYHGAALIAVRPEAAGAGLDLIRRLWRTRFLRTSLLLVTVDADFDPADRSRVLWRALNQAEPAQDVLLDGGRMGVDATEKKGRSRVCGDAGVLRYVARRWKEYGIGGELGEKPQ